MEFNKSKPMPIGELRRLMAEQTIKENSSNINLQEGINRNNDIDYHDCINEHVELEQAKAEKQKNKSEFLYNVKSTLLFECLYKLYRESYSMPMTATDKVIAKNLITNFVNENGAQNLITNFSQKNLVLSEFSRICTKYYNMVLEECDCGGKCCDNDNCLFVSPEIKDAFLDDLEDVDTEKAADSIKKRVADSVSDFVNDNMEQKIQYDDIIKDAKSKIEKAQSEDIAESYSMIARRKINEMKMSKEKSIFHYMVESLATKVIKDEDLQSKYMEGAKLNMDKIVNDTQLVYNMLEMVNTTEMINITESYLDEYLKSL